MLEARGLRKRFGARIAVEDVGFTVRKGESVALLGPNGAGKTTTISMIAGLSSPDAGEVRIDGAAISSDTDPRKRLIGLVPQELALYEELSAEANLRIFGGLYGLAGAALEAAIGRALEIVRLGDRRRDRVSEYSGGMKRRINLAAALLHGPRLVILDEPTVGVDPQSRNAIFENIEALAAEGCAILYTTHYMEEAERLCEHVVIVDHGRVIADDTRARLIERASTGERLTLELDAPPSEALRAALGPSSVKGASLTLERPDLSSVGEIVATVAAHGAKLRAIRSEAPSLEAVFLALTGRSLRDP